MVARRNGGGHGMGVSKRCAQCGAEITAATPNPKRAKFCGSPCWLMAIRGSWVEQRSDGYVLVMRNGESMISPEDVAFVSSVAWRIDSNGYARNTRKGRLHRLLLNTPAGLVVDHINQNKLDNRRANLRVVEHAVNLHNGKLNARNTSGHRGVTWNALRRRWYAWLSVKWRHDHLGSFPTIGEAIDARLRAERQLGWRPEVSV